jgi:hypothetical protein
MAKFRGPKKMFGMKKMAFLLVALVLLFGIWFFFLRGGREGLEGYYSDVTDEAGCKAKNGTWNGAESDKEKKCKQAAAAVATAAKANDSAMDAISAAQKALGGLGMPK